MRANDGMTPHPEPPHFIILEDHTLVRQLIERRIRDLYSEARIAYQGPSVLDAVEAAGSHSIAAIILDLDLGDGTSAEEHSQALQALDVPILIVSASASAGVVQRALSQGAYGFVSKQCDVHEFDQALLATVAREEYVSRDLARLLAAAPQLHQPLSEQETRALALYASGLKIEAVARQMGVSRGTASEYIKRVRSKYAKAGVALPSKVDLYQKAKEEGII